MGKNVQVKLKLAGLNKLMRSEPVQAEVNNAAGRVAAKAGPKFRVNPSGKNAHKWTARAFVEPVDASKPVSDADRLALLRALSGG